MVDRKPAASGSGSPAAAAYGGGLPDSMVAYAPLRPFLLLSVDMARTMVGMQREMMDLTRGVLRQQQDTMIATMLQGLRDNRASDHAPSWNAQAQDGLAGLARFSLSAFDRMAAALRASNDPQGWTSVQGAAPGRSTEPR